MVEMPEIKLHKGFCSLAFGANKESAVLIFGEPEEVQDMHDEILNTSTLVYHYWDQGYSLFFDLNRSQAFCSVEIDNKETLLFNIKIFTLKEKEIVLLMKEHGHPLSDTEVHQWGERRVSFDSAGLDFYFENNKLTSVNFSVPEIENKFVYFPN